MGLSVSMVLVGNKGKQYFGRRPQYNIASEYTWKDSCCRHLMLPLICNKLLVQQEQQQQQHL